jgi:hypothetical protein
MGLDAQRKSNVSHAANTATVFWITELQGAKNGNPEDTQNHTTYDHVTNF